jgi:transposase
MKGGIDWLRYREIILKQYLYLWAKEIVDKTGRLVYCVEDNASPHSKAKRLSLSLRAYPDYNGKVFILDWLARSPDLNKIERCWDSIKDLFEKLRAQHHGN